MSSSSSKGTESLITARYRKRPVEVEAVRLERHAPDWNALRDFFGQTSGAGLWRAVGFAVEIQTLEGVMRADPGDWIVKGIAGEFYPVKPDIFARTYEPVGA